ncbi:hypothetical protein [Spirulina subsalsa]|uniref:hypothetical protein n=1 Tax=Spirulina subsalsa TaxID=54311 RepID=UPI0003752CDB|nr:hypothetical protein [Spirulina subsalsa]
MNSNNRRLLIFASIILSLVLVGIIWALTLPATSAQYPRVSPAVPIVQAERKPDSDRLQAVIDCLPPELSINNKDTRDRINRALDEMQNEQLERMFQVKDNPKLNEAEEKFERCLKNQ